MVCFRCVSMRLVSAVIGCVLVVVCCYMRRGCFVLFVDLSRFVSIACCLLIDVCCLVFGD